MNPQSCILMLRKGDFRYDFDALRALYQSHSENGHFCDTFDALSCIVSKVSQKRGCLAKVKTMGRTLRF